MIRPQVDTPINVLPGTNVRRTCERGEPAALTCIPRKIFFSHIRKVVTYVSSHHLSKSIPGHFCVPRSSKHIWDSGNTIHQHLLVHKHRWVLARSKCGCV